MKELAGMKPRKDTVAWPKFSQVQCRSKGQRWRSPCRIMLIWLIDHIFQRGKLLTSNLMAHITEHEYLHHWQVRLPKTWKLWLAVQITASYRSYSDDHTTSRTTCSHFQHTSAWFLPRPRTLFFIYVCLFVCL